MTPTWSASARSSSARMAVSRPGRNSPWGPIVDSATLTILPATATLYPGLPTTFILSGGTGAYIVTSDNQAIIPIAGGVTGRSVTLVPNPVATATTVTLTLRDTGAAAPVTATLTVRDNGHGITDLENLFEPFYTTKKPGEGVGLGLAISSGIVTDLGGRLTARNGDSGGAVFEVQLPILGPGAGSKQEAAE